MVEFGTRLALVCLQLSFLTEKTTASIWRPDLTAPSLPSDPKDPFYQAFQNVPSPQITAESFVKNFVRRGLSPVAKRQTSNEDVVAVIDGSGSIGACEFNKGKNALSYLMDSAKESNPTVDTKYATITFSTSVTVNFKFLQYVEAAKKVKTISYPSGWTNTQAGLEEAMKLFSNPLSSGGRIFGRKVVLLLTDGQSNVDQQLTIPKADVLKNNGVKIFVIAIGGYIKGIDEMVKVASYPPKDFLFRVSDYRGFVEVIKLVIKEVAPGKYNIIEGQYNPPC